MARPPATAYSDNDYVIGSRDGSEVYTFDSHGRHLATHDARRGTLLYSITHDAQGRLQSITDAEGNTTSVQRAADGAPEAITGPYGHRTRLSIDADGWTTSIEDPTLKQNSPHVRGPGRPARELHYAR